MICLKYNIDGSISAPYLLEIYRQN